MLPTGGLRKDEGAMRMLDIETQSVKMNMIALPTRKDGKNRPLSQRRQTHCFRCVEPSEEYKRCEAKSREKGIRTIQQ